MYCLLYATVAIEATTSCVNERGLGNNTMSGIRYQFLCRYTRLGADAFSNQVLRRGWPDLGVGHRERSVLVLPPFDRDHK
eukprot:SAG22_NODE_9000_length_615_cov_1.189922_1_plen_79_part_10